MHTACNTLPTPEQFDILTANHTQYATAPIDIEAGLEETQCAPAPPDISKLTNPDAIALAIYGPEWYAKMQRVEECGEFVVVQHCDNGHPLHNLSFLCQLNFSECCRDKHAQKTIKRLTPVIDFFSEPPPAFRNSRFVALDIATPAPRDRAAIEAAFNKIGHDIEKFHEADEHWIYPTFKMCLGFWEGCLIVRVLIADLDGQHSSKIPSDSWKRTWPDCKVSVTVGKHMGFRSAFNHLLKALPLKDPADRMEHEVLFAGMQRLRSASFKLLLPNAANPKEDKEIDDVAEYCVEPTTQYPETDANSNHAKVKSPPSCPICGHPCDQFSGKLRVNSQELMEYLAKKRGIVHTTQPPG